MSVAVFLEYACFSLAHWYFGHQYFKIAIVMPFLKKKLAVPVEIEKSFARNDTVMITLNILPSIAFGIAKYGE